jgi:Tol biopolymer transport system component
MIAGTTGSGKSELLRTMLAALALEHAPDALNFFLVDYKGLSDLWRADIKKTYLPQVASQQRARDIAREMLSERRSEGTLHLAPALSPDGKEVAYFSEKDFYFVDLYLADAATGKVKRRLLKSSYSSNYETFRFINSAASWSADGKYLTVAAKRGPRDEILIIDVARNREAKRIRVKLDGVTTPTWSPDGRQLVFTGYVGGLSDLYLVNADGSNLRRLTNDRYADLHPVWSPDGKTIAFATDRGPETNFETLHVGNMRIATYDLASGRIDLLPGMDLGKNVSPQWSPDGEQIAFISDRAGGDAYGVNAVCDFNRCSHNYRLHRPLAKQHLHLFVGWPRCEAADRIEDSG